MYKVNADTGNPEVVKAGYLTKSPPGDAPPMSQWRRRWFVLCDSLRAYPLAERHVRLEYYQHEGDVRKMCDPKGVIDLKHCTRVSGVARLKGHNHVFDICTKERTYHIAAETPTEKFEWMKTLNELLFTPPAVSEGAKVVHDLENAEMLRKKSISKASAERQSSLGEINERNRPTSCFVQPGMQPISEATQRQDKSPMPPVSRRQQQLEFKKRPLPPTPSNSNVPTSLSPTHAMSQQQPPIPKPRLLRQNQEEKPIPVTASLPVGDIAIQYPSSAYENVSNSTVSRGGGSNSEQPPAVPKHRGRISLDSPTLPSGTQQHNATSPQLSLDVTSLRERSFNQNGAGAGGYENLRKSRIPPVTTTAPDYEDINVEDEIETCYETQIFSDEPIGGHMNKRNGNQIRFLDEDIYNKSISDLNNEDLLYESPQMDPMTYEVPVSLWQPSSPVVTQQHNLPNIAAGHSLLDSADNPPVPPPRQKKTYRKDSSIHSSLINLADDGLYSELNQDLVESTEFSSDDEHYGRLIRMTGLPNRERRFSDPEIIPVSPRSHSNSPLFFATRSKQTPSPPPPYSKRMPVNQQQKRYYENTGYCVFDPSKTTVTNKT